MKTYRFITILTLLAISITAEAQDKHILDSMRREVSKASTDTGRIDTRLGIVYYYLNDSYDIGRLDTAERYLEQANKLNRKHDTPEIQNLGNLCYALLYSFRNPDEDPKKRFLPVIAACHKTGDKENEMLAWGYLAYFTKKSPASSPFRLICYEKEMALAHQQIGDEYQEMFDLNEIADIHTLQKKYSLAESELFQVIKRSKQAGSHNVMAAYDLLGEVYIEKGEFNKALYYEIKYQKGIELAGDTATAGNAYVRLAYIYGYLRNYPSALEWAKKSLSNLIATNELDNLFYTSNTIVVAYINARRPVEALKFLSAMTAKYKPVKPRDREYVQFSFGNIYKALKNYPMAEKSYLEMVKLIDTRVNAGDNIDKADEYEAIGNFYLDRKKYAPAQQYLETSLKYLGKKGLLGMLERVHLSLFKVDSALGDYKSAIRQLRLNNKIRDSIFNTARDNQVEEMNIQYQTQEKEKDIKLAQAKDKLEQAQLERTQNGRNWIVAGLGLLLIIAGLLYRQSRLRKNNNQLITQKNELLQKLLAEKEWLLKEVHHRVKNNLHTVICLLESQARYLENDALKAIESSQHRIYAMSLIHQKLYQSDDIKTIDMAIYIPELVKSLEDSFDVSNQIQFKLNVQRVNLDISHAIPLGLIINEAITNSIKYAFPNNRKGEISVLMLNNNDRIKLVLADNGIGMPPINFDVESESLGLRLMKGLSEDIDAIISFEVDKGTRIKVVFNVDLLNTSNNPFVNLKEGGIYE